MRHAKSGHRHLNVRCCDVASASEEPTSTNEDMRLCGRGRDIRPGAFQVGVLGAAFAFALNQHAHGTFLRTVTRSPYLTTYPSYHRRRKLMTAKK